MEAQATKAASGREPRTNQELVVDLLRESILNGKLRGGSRLIQDRIATELRVSRVPVREALLQLESEGLVRMEAHRGATVVWLSPVEIAEIFEIRALLVTEAIRRVVPRLTVEQLSRLEQIARKQSGEASMTTRARLNHQFYTTLFESLDRPRLRAMMDRLEREVERYLLPLGRPHLGHLELVDACRQRDAERAALLVQEHLEQVGERAVARVSALQEVSERPVPARRSSRAARPRSASRTDLTVVHE
jgi:DNA-binding GntR family transcriptional regulator